MIICDIDNCIADDEWRIRHINHGMSFDDPLRFSDYHQLAGFDELCNREILMGRGGKIVFFTGRPVGFRALTTEWLRRQDIKYAALVMRAPQDIRPCAEVKRDMLRMMLKQVNRKDIVCAYDDRQEVIEVYKAYQIKVQRTKIHDTPYHLPDVH